MLNNRYTNKYVVFIAMAVAVIIILAAVGWILYKYLIPWTVSAMPYSLIAYMVVFIAAVVYFL